MKEQLHGAAYDAVRQIYDRSPGRSWRRLNGALQDTLKAAITAHLSFLPEDFAAIFRDMKGGYWMGNSCGSECGDGYYSHAVKVGHTAAAISFENYVDRPPALWSEDVKAPQRLRVGSEFTWDGMKLHVNDLKSSYLNAALYEPGALYEDTLKVGSVIYFDGGHRVIEALGRTSAGVINLRMSAALAPPNPKPKRLFKITYEELTAKRKALDAERKRVLVVFATAATEAALEAAIKDTMKSATAFRPFDLKDFREAIAIRMKELRGQKKPGYRGSAGA